LETGDENESKPEYKSNPINLDKFVSEWGVIEDIDGLINHIVFEYNREIADRVKIG
jgi:hypothetical protein